MIWQNFTFSSIWIRNLTLRFWCWHTLKSSIICIIFQIPLEWKYIMNTVVTLETQFKLSQFLNLTIHSPGAHTLYNSNVGLSCIHYHFLVLVHLSVNTFFKIQQMPCILMITGFLKYSIYVILFTSKIMCRRLYVICIRKNMVTMTVYKLYY